MNVQHLQQQELKSQLRSSRYNHELMVLDQQEKTEFFKEEWIQELIAFAQILNETRVIN